MGPEIITLLVYEVLELGKAPGTAAALSPLFPIG